MKILNLAPYPLYPVKAGNQVLTENMCNYLSKKGHEVGYMFIDYGDKSYEMPEDLQRWLEYSSVTGALGAPILGLLRRIVNKLYLKIGGSILKLPFLMARKDLALIENTIKQNKYDVVIVHFPIFARLNSLIHKCGAKSVLMTHDLHFLRQQRLADFGKVNRLLSLSREKELELSMYREFDQVSVVSSHEYDLLLDEGFEKEKISLTGISIEFPSQLIKQDTEWDLLFVGTAGHQPNVDGMQWFLTEVWGSIVAKYPNISLAIAGTIGEALPENYAGKENVHTLGFVDSLDELYASSKIVIIPLRFGTGIKVKFIEALSHGKVVIATEIGSEGLSINSPEHYLMANTPEEWLEALSGLMADAAVCDKLEKNAQRWAHENVSHEAVWSPLNYSLDDLARASRQQSS